jgi:tetratricopeptide (TPR) repeat protein
LIKLTELMNINAPFISKHAAALYVLLAREKGWGLFDERDHFLGEAALLAAGGHRLMGNRHETEAWLQRASMSFGHILSPQPFLARCMYARLALEYDKKRLKLVLESIPSLLASFEKFGMRSDLAKARLLEAMTLKECSRKQEALQKFDALRQSLQEVEDAGLLGCVHAGVGELLSWEGRYPEALANYQKAQGLLSSTSWGFGLANLKLCVGESLQFQGRLSSAVQAYREAATAYAEAGVATAAAYSRLVLATALLDLGRHDEAESEVLAALPTLEEHEMVPQAVAAVALLRESVRARRTDPDALRELREHLKGRT